MAVVTAAGLRVPVAGGGYFRLLPQVLLESAIRKVLAASDPAEAVQQLIDAANAAGGVDNITAVVVKVLEL